LADRPVVLVEGVPDVALRVAEYRASGLLDERRCVLCPADATGGSRPPGLLPRNAELAWPHRLNDGGVRWEVLAKGVLGPPEVGVERGEKQYVYALVDDWSCLLDRVFAQGSAGHTGMSHGAAPEAAPATLADALETLDPGIGETLSVGLLPAGLQRAPVSAATSPADAQRSVLLRWLREAGCRVRCERWRAGGVTHGMQALVPTGMGRDVFLPWADGRRGGVETLRMGSDATPGQAVLSGAWPTLRVGDRLLDLGGPGRNARGASTAVERDTAVVTEVVVRFGTRTSPPETTVVFKG
jgi:hypothetical protein